MLQLINTPGKLVVSLLSVMLVGTTWSDCDAEGLGPTPSDNGKAADSAAGGRGRVVSVLWTASVRLVSVFEILISTVSVRLSESSLIDASGSCLSESLSVGALAPGLPDFSSFTMYSVFAWIVSTSSETYFNHASCLVSLTHEYKSKLIISNTYSRDCVCCRKQVSFDTPCLSSLLFSMILLGSSPCFPWSRALQKNHSLLSR